MKPMFLCGALALVAALLAMPFPAAASLGGDVCSVHADVAKMQATLRTSSTDIFTVHEIQSPSGITVREYVSPGGSVFAVTWRGAFHPDLRQLLGTYHEQYLQAVQAQRAHRRGRGPLLIQQPGLVIRISGHMHAFQGRAYVPQMMPAGVRAEELP